MNDTSEMVTLSRHERKDRLGHGAMKEIAAELGVDPSAVSRVVNGKATSARIAKAVAARLGLPVEVVFGTRRQRQAA